MAHNKDNLTSTTKTTPKDAQVMSAILKEMGFNDYEPRVINQMLEFCYRYTSSIIEDAQQYSAHAKKKNVDASDINLAIALQEDRSFARAPDRDLTVELARQRNCIPLPQIRSTAGLRLPPDRYTLTACNYKLKPAGRKTRTVHTVSRINMNIGGLASNSVAKSSPTIVHKTPPTVITKPPVSSLNAPKQIIMQKPVTPQISQNLTEATKSVNTSQASTANTTPLILPTAVAVKSEPKPLPATNSSMNKQNNDDDYDMQ